MTGMQRKAWAATAALALVMAWTAGSRPAAQSAPKNTPDTPFKLMTFEAGGATRVGMVLGTRVLDIAGANRHVSERGEAAGGGHPHRDEGAHRAVRDGLAAAVSDRQLLRHAGHRRTCPSPST